MKKYLFLTVSTLVLFSCSNSEENGGTVDFESRSAGFEDNHVECSTDQHASDVYNYMSFESSEFKKLVEKSGGDMAKIFEAFEIPADVLKKMSTKGIIQSYAEYPFFNDMNIYPSWRSYVENVFRNMNIAKELMGRKDAGQTLLELYKAFSDGCVSEGKSPQYVSVLVSVPEICSTLSDAEKKAFVAEVLRKDALCQQFYGDGTARANSSLMYVCGKLLQAAKYQPMLDLINADSEINEFLNEHPIPVGIPDHIGEIKKIGNDYIQ